MPIQTIRYYVTENGKLEERSCPITEFKEGCYLAKEELARFMGVNPNRLKFYFYPNFRERYERETNEKVNIKLIKRKHKSDLVYFDSNLMKYLINADEILKIRYKINSRIYRRRNVRGKEEYISFSQIQKQLIKENYDLRPSLRFMSAILVLPGSKTPYRISVRDAYINKKDVDKLKLFIINKYLPKTKKLKLEFDLEEEPSDKELEEIVEEEFK